MDMPENCGKCDFCKNCFCYAPGITDDKNDVIDYVQIKTKPDYCPLKPMPEKDNRKFSSYRWRWYTEGWNACIDEILKDGEAN